MDRYTMKLADWARKQGVTYKTAYRYTAAHFR
jgi:predicted site-specific integrase-resolvase